MLIKKKIDDKKLDINPKTLINSVKFSLVDLCTFVLNHIYKRGSYSEYKVKFTNDLLEYVNVHNFQERIFSQNFREQFTQLFNDLLSQPAFGADHYMIPLFLLTFSLRNGSYDARNAALIQNIIQYAKLNEIKFEKYEDKLLDLITYGTTSPNKKFKPNKIKKYWKIAAASIIGGSLIGLTGGLLAAPFLAVSVGTLFGSAWLTTMMGTTAGLGIIGSLFGVTGAALTGYKMNRRTGDLEEFSFQKLKPSNPQDRPGKGLRFTIAISGWISKDCDFAMPWHDLRITKECYTLCWESTYLKEFGQGVNYVANWATGQIAQEVLKETALAGVLSAIAWPMNLISLARVIDNPWAVAFARTKRAGQELANVLTQRVAGRRPVNLIAFGLGSRVVYHALTMMAEDTPNNDNRGIVQDVILMGSPIPADDRKVYTLWMDYIVAGKFINCYCTKDWILKLLYRTSSAQVKIAGLQPIERYNTRMYNINLSDIVEGHNDYVRKMPLILKTLGYNSDNIYIESVPSSPS